MAEVDLAVSLAADERDSDQKAYWEKLKELPLDALESDLTCKGILVANTFRASRPIDRVDPDFPDAMQRKIAPMGICALTGLQLFGLVIEARQFPETKSKIVQALFETDGVLSRASDWRAYLLT